MPTALNHPEDDGDFSEVDFLHFLRRLLEARFPTSHIAGEDRGVDLILDHGGERILVEVKRVTPQTLSRLDRVVAQLHAARDRLEAIAPMGRVRLVLALPGALSPNRADVLHGQGIDVWDRNWILETADETNLTVEAMRFVDGPAALPPTSHGRELQRRLEATPPGRPHWSQYQKLIGEILHYLFCPPLSVPISERSNETETNRRDFILPNYAEDGIWAFLRGRYQADHIVVDAKNYTDEVKKTEVLQLANYLSTHGPGNLGLIVTRKGGDNSALVTRREQWIIHNKLILVLDDSDIKQMLEVKDSAGEADLLIRQKIEDFRLSI